MHSLFYFNFQISVISAKQSQSIIKRIGGVYLSKNVTVITEPEGKKIVLINDIRFKGKTKEEWKK